MSRAIRIMIVEDDPSAAMGLARLLNIKGYEVMSMVQTGDAAVETAVREKPDLILMDVILAGGKDGIMAADQIRATHDIPIIFLTALKDADTFTRATRSNPYAYLIKPINFSDLERCIELTLNQHSRQRQLKDVEKRLRLNEDSLRSLLSENRARNDFMATMSHELRTPMTSVLGMAELLQTSSLTGQQRQLVSGIIRSAEGLLDIINDVLDTARVESGNLELRPAPFNMRGLCEDVLEMFSPRAREAGIELILDAPLDLPLLLNGDAGRIRQILINLVGNALKWTTAGSISIEISWSETGDGTASMTTTVADTGCGIAADKQPHLFDKYFQIDTPDGVRPAGTGLGLAISRSLVELMGGGIGVSSILGSGSNFWFSLPLAIVEKWRRPPEPHDLAGIRVLVADGLARSRDMLTGYLEGLGLRCESAPSAQAALSLLRQADSGGDPFRIVLADETLPGMEYARLASEIRSCTPLDPPRLVLIASSLSASDSAENNLFPYAACLTKPVRLKRLMDLLEAVCLEPGPETAPATAVRPESHEECAQAPAPPSVLVVEDNPDSRLVITTMLEQAGCRAGAAIDGRQALEMLQDNSYDLILMDCNLPGMNGFETTAEIRRRETGGRRSVIVALTANVLAGYREQCLAAGMDDFLGKPLRSRDIRTIVKRWIPSMSSAAVASPPESRREAGVKPALEELFDAHRLNELILMFRTAGKDFFPDVLIPYLNNAEARLSELHTAVACDDTAQVRDLAHFLQGGSRSIGLRVMTQACARLMETAMGNDGQRLRSSADHLMQTLPQVRQQVNNLRELGML